MQMGAEPIAANNAIAPDVEPPSPVHNVLVTCGIMIATYRDVLMNIEGLDLLAAFTSMNGDPDVTRQSAWHIDQMLPLAGSFLEQCRLEGRKPWFTGSKTAIDVEWKPDANCGRWM